MNKTNNIKKITLAAVMTAISTIVYYILPEIQLVPGVDYLKIDFSDMPAIATGIMIGPAYGILVEVVKNIIHLLRTTTFGIGELMNIGMGTAMILSIHLFSKLFSKVYKKDTMSTGVYYTSSVCTIIVSIVAGWVLNSALTPIYFLIMGIEINAVTLFAGVWGSTLLNAIKSALNFLPFFPIYFAVNKAFSKIFH